MRKRELMVCALLGVVFAFTPLAAAQNGPPPASKPTIPDMTPRLVLTPTEVDFGEVWHGAKPVAEVTLTNAGTAPLDIIKIDPGCGCTTVNKPKNRLAPGESDVLRVEYASGKKRVGTINRSVSIRTNDPVQPRAVLRLRGEVKQLVEGAPGDSIAFGELSGDETVTKSIELTVTYDEPLHLKLKKPAEGPFDLKLEELEPGVRYRLSATSKPQLNQGVSSMEAELLTGLTDIPEFPIAVRAIIRPRVSVSPSLLYIPAKINRSITKRIRVTYLSAQPIQITKIESDCEKITAEVDTPQSAPAAGRFAYHRISVILPPGKEIPETGAKLFIYTNAPEERYAKLVVDITNQMPRRGGPSGMRNAHPSNVPANPSGQSDAGKPGGEPEEP